MRATFLAGGLASLLIATAAVAQTKPCGPVDHARAIQQAWIKTQSAQSPGRELGMDEAICHQRRLVARLGALGKAVKMRSDAEFVDALAKMRVKLSDDEGRGERLMPGDKISLGSFGRPIPPPRGLTLTASYAGLPTGPMSVTVAFR